MDSIRSREYVCIGKGSLVYVSGVLYRDKNTKREGGLSGKDQVSVGAGPAFES